MLTQADEARTETENAKIKEKVQVEVLGSYDDNGIFKMEKLKENLEKNLNIAKEEITDNGDGSITFLLDETRVTVDEEGKAELGERVPLIKATKIEVEDLVIEEGKKQEN